MLYNDEIFREESKKTLKNAYFCERFAFWDNNYRRGQLKWTFYWTLRKPARIYDALARQYIALLKKEKSASLGDAEGFFSKAQI